MVIEKDRLFDEDEIEYTCYDEQDETLEEVLREELKKDIYDED